MDIDNMDFPLPGYSPPAATVSPTDLDKFKTWTMIYPVYMDISKTTEEGRKISKTESVDTPAAVYIAEAAKSLSIPTLFEPDKRHPKDAFMFGRVRMQLKRDNGSFINPQIKSKKQLIRKLASLVPLMKQKSDPQMTQMANMSLSVLPPALSSVSSPSSSQEISSSKKNKKNIK